MDTQEADFVSGHSVAMDARYGAKGEVQVAYLPSPLSPAGWWWLTTEPP